MFVFVNYHFKAPKNAYVITLVRELTQIKKRGHIYARNTVLCYGWLGCFRNETVEVFNSSSARKVFHNGEPFAVMVGLLYRLRWTHSLTVSQRGMAVCRGNGFGLEILVHKGRGDGKLEEYGSEVQLKAGICKLI